MQPERDAKDRQLDAQRTADTVRDVRGFATKFYTRQGDFDLVGNTFPAFFIQDGIKFPDFVHAVKPEPHNEIPQAQSAHDTFWDFIQNGEYRAVTSVPMGKPLPLPSPIDFELDTSIFMV